jgi:hypothetical protein
MTSWRNRQTGPAACLFLLGFLTFLLLPALAFSQDDDSSQSLGDVARKLRKDTTDEVRMSDADAKKLFESVDKIIAFAAQDTGMPKRADVKRRMVGKEDVEKFASGRMAREGFTQRFAQEELSMKKLGFLPKDFHLREFLVKATGQQIAGYYDEETKSISLLNWVPFDRQEPILAHELTHALQDQNYDLSKWMKAGAKPAGNGANSDTSDDGPLARKAVVEGQAMVVYVDYLLAPMNRNLVDTPDLIYQMEEPVVKAAADTQMLHDAPMILREAGTFPYQEGLIFEGELLHKGGREMAFAGAFARPPRNSHEIMQPESYINVEKAPRVGVPDVKHLLSGQYEVYESGTIGELDVRALMKQYGERKSADDVASFWQGGAYVTYRKEKAPADGSGSTADLALLYVSKWKTPQAAERFAHFYASAVGRRYTTATSQSVDACSGPNCPVWSAQILTEEGPVIVQHWADNRVIISESFDPSTAAKLQKAVRDGVADEHAEMLPQQDLPDDEVGMRLYDIPAFRAFAEQIGRQVAEELLRGAKE